MTRLLAAVALAPLLIAGAAHASSVLTDTFDADTPQLNWPGDATFTSVGTGMTGSPSTDLVSSGSYGFPCAGGSGNCVDLDGSTGSGNNPAGELLSTATFGPGTYTLSFDLSGNGRGAPAQTTVVSLGGFSQSITLPSSAAFSTYTYTFSTTGGQLEFLEQGPSDQEGNVLDNVSLASVPEPATWALMLAGFGMVGATVRRRVALRA